MSTSSLEGKTILRFTHAYQKAGGVEQYLATLDRVLLNRNCMTIIRLYLPDHISGNCPELIKFKKGVLVKIPMTAKFTRPTQISSNKGLNPLFALKLILKENIRDHLFYNPIVGPVFQSLRRPRLYSEFNREPTDAKAIFNGLLNDHDVSLVVNHMAGGRGGYEIFREANQRKIPCVILNHFANTRFKQSSIRSQMNLVRSVGGVSAQEVPKHVKPIFYNVSDGVDTEFFKNTCAKHKKNNHTPVIFLCARIVRGKGHADLLSSFHLLKKKGIECQIAFAGREDDHKLLKQLKDYAVANKMANYVHFLGQLDLESLKKWYQLSCIIALPSYSEGLPRVLLEAQSMEVPVVAYNSGGTCEGMLNGITGYLVRKGDIGLFAERTKLLLQNPELRRQMGVKGRQFILEEFSLTKLAERHEGWYLDAISSNTL